MLGRDFLVGVHEVDVGVIGRPHNMKRSPSRRFLQAQHLREKSGGGALVARRNDRVIELHTHGASPLLAWSRRAMHKPAPLVCVSRKRRLRGTVPGPCHGQGHGTHRAHPGAAVAIGPCRWCGRRVKAKASALRATLTRFRRKVPKTMAACT